MPARRFREDPTGTRLLMISTSPVVLLTMTIINCSQSSDEILTRKHTHARLSHRIPRHFSLLPSGVMILMVCKEMTSAGCYPQPNLLVIWYRLGTSALCPGAPPIDDFSDLYFSDLYDSFGILKFQSGDTSHEYTQRRNNMYSCAF